MRNLAIRNSVLGGSGSALPYDAEVEYLESTGTQYILFANIGNNIDIDTWVYPANNADYGAIGRWNGGSRCDGIGYATIGSRGLWVRNAGNSSPVYVRLLVANHFAHIVVSDVSVKVDNDDFTMGSRWSGTYVGASLGLFGCYNNNTSEMSLMAAKIGHTKIYLDGVLVRELRPVRKSGVGYFYDEVTEELVGNQGTGAFIIGPDKVSQLGGGV